MSRRAALLPSLMALALAAGCNSTALPSGGDGGGGGGGDGAVTGGPCPAAWPGPAQACSMVGLQCSYGDDPRPSCRATAVCTASGWVVQSAPRCTTPSCPSPAPMNADACSMDGAFCVEADGTTCSCSTCPPVGPVCMTGPTKWWCSPPPGDPSCPRTPPNLGAPCTSDGLQCSYSGCTQGSSVKCSGGYWQDLPVACPA